MRRVILKITLVFLSALLLFSCAGEKRSCEEIFYERYGKDTLPFGRLYLLRAREWEDGYLSKELFSSLYAYTSENADRELDALEDCAVYLSSSLDEFCEIGVFLCYGNADTEQIAKMCHKRISLISSLRGLSGASADIAAQGGRVEIKGRYVIYSFVAPKKQ